MIENIDLTKAPHSCGVYFFKDVNDVVIYVGSSKNLYNRLAEHKSCIRKGSEHGYITDLYRFLQSSQFTVEFQLTDDYRQLEQELIEKYNPIFNKQSAFTGLGKVKGNEVEYQKNWHILHKEERHIRAKERYNINKIDILKKAKQRDNQLCCYNGQILKLKSLRMKLAKLGFEHPTLEAKKYLITTN